MGAGIRMRIGMLHRYTIFKHDFNSPFTLYRHIYVKFMRFFYNSLSKMSVNMSILGDGAIEHGDVWKCYTDSERPFAVNIKSSSAWTTTCRFQLSHKNNRLFSYNPSRQFPHNRHYSYLQSRKPCVVKLTTVLISCSIYRLLEFNYVILLVQLLVVWCLMYWLKNRFI